jgi:hypothetical protein
MFLIIGDFKFSLSNFIVMLKRLILSSDSNE